MRADWTYRPQTRRLGLALLGAVCWLTGLGIGRTPLPPPEQRLPYEEWPIELRMLVWAVPGTVALLAAVWPRLDGAAWTLLVLPWVERGSAYAYAWLWGDFHTLQSTWRSMLMYATIALLVVLMAAGLGRPDPLTRRQMAAAHRPPLRPS